MARFASVFLPALGAGLITFAAPAAAADREIVVTIGEAGSVTRSTSVSSAGLDLASAEGRAILDQRVRRAAKEVCAYNSMHGLRSPADYTDCADHAVSDARSQASRLTATHAAGGGGSGAR